jgi:hypothetical protein
MIQFVSQVAPPSAENACSQRADRGVISDQMKWTRIGRPSNTSSPRKVPTPFSKRPWTGGSRRGLRPSIHQIDHSPASGSNARSVAAR